MTDIPLLDEETVEEMSLVELYAARNTLRARMDRLQEQLNIVNKALYAKGPTRFGEVVMLPASKKWSPFDKTFAAVRHWCGSADAFLEVAHVDYVRVTGLVHLARERAEADGRDADKAIELVLNSLGTKVPAGEYPTFVPLHKAAKKYQRLPDAFAEDVPERRVAETGEQLLEALRAGMEAKRGTS